MGLLPPDLRSLESESIHILREVAAGFDNPVLLYSIGKDSGALLHLSMKAFWPGRVPFSFLHVDTGWKFRDMIQFRTKIAEELGINLIIHTNPEGERQALKPFGPNSATYTQIMKTEALKQALDHHRFDAVIGGARRDEERSRAKERIFSVRSEGHVWDPRRQQPELWRNYNTSHATSETVRVFPLSNWTERDVWRYTAAEGIPVVPLYLARPRPVVRRAGTLIMVDDGRLELAPDEKVETVSIRFRSLGCYPLSGAVESSAATIQAVIEEMGASNTSERQGRLIDHDQVASMERKKREGYF